jgi:hypothetical protein
MMTSLPRGLLAAFLILMLPVRASAMQNTEDRRPADQIADSVEIANTARTVTAGASSDSARASMLYEYVATGVRYDVKSFLSGSQTDNRAETIFRKRLAVCAGYVALYTRMAAEVGLHTQTIHGYAKGFNYVNGQATTKPNHSWVALQLGTSWFLVDPTWASGTVGDGKFEPHFTWDYFLVSPRELQLSHFPEDPAWQLVPTPMTRNEFEHMSAIPRTLIKVGFDPDTLRVAAKRVGAVGFPLVSEKFSHVHVIAAPTAGTLARAQRVAMDIVWPGVSDVAVVTGGVWTKLSRDGDRFQGEATAAGKDVMVIGRNAGQDYQTLLFYKVQ